MPTSNSTNFLVAKFTVVLVAFFKFSPAISQVYGCRDAAATNYNSMATVNDGSCTYSATTYIPVVKVDPISDTLIESSGLQWANNSLWSFNDGGGEAAIYRIDTATKNILQTVRLTGATNVDWEDIAFDGKNFYVGDFGNNANGARTDLVIYKFSSALIPGDYLANPVVSIAAVSISKINFRYSDQPQPPAPTSNNNTKYDCEAMIADGGQLHIFTKNWISNISIHYVINSQLAGSYIATPVDTLNTGYLVTGADKSPTQKVVVLLGYQNSGSGNHFMHVLSDYKKGRYFSGNKRKLNLPNALTMGQAEGIAFRNGKYGYISNEKFTRTVSGFTIIISQKLQSFNLSTLTPAYLSSKTDFFRTAKTGTWNEDTTWETSVDKRTWITATETPDSTADTTYIRKGHAVTITDTLSIDKTIVLPTAALVVNSQLTVINTGLVLGSDSTADARIGTSIGSISGDVEVQRYIPARRAWRLINTPFAEGQDIYSAWQESQHNLPGFGTHITGGSAVNGFDQSPTNNASIKYYDATTNSSVPLTTTHLATNTWPAYFLFVRGDRTINLSLGTGAPATNTTLRASGTLKTGDQNLAVAANKLALIGNPFASAINFATMTKTNIPDRFFVWDPKRATIGAYVLLEGPDYMPLTTGGSYTGTNSVIQSGQAFFVQGGAATGVLGILESSKTSTYHNVFKAAEDTDAKMQVNLYFLNADSTASLADATATRYNNLYETAVTPEDAAKPDNLDENIAILRDNKLLTVERRPIIAFADTNFFRIYNMYVKNYRLEILPKNFDTSLLSAYLEDSYLKKSSPVSLARTAFYNFSITTDTLSARGDRFRIIYKLNSTLPLNFTAVQGRVANNEIEIKWQIANGINISQYEIWKSADGRSFTKIGFVSANQNASLNYSWIDKNTVSGNNFYQIKAIEYSGNTITSPVINVRTGNIKQEILVYPNPTVDKAICLQFYNQPKGTYSLQLFNNAGQKVFSTSINHPGGSLVQTIRLTGADNKGMYNLQITNGQKKTALTLMVD